MNSCVVLDAARYQNIVLCHPRPVVAVMRVAPKEQDKEEEEAITCAAKQLATMRLVCYKH